MDDQGVLPLIGLLVLLVIVGIGLLVVGWIVVAFTMKSVIAILLVGMGLYLFVKPSAVSSMGAQAKVAVPLILIVLGILVYSGVFSSIV